MLSHLALNIVLFSPLSRFFLLASGAIFKIGSKLRKLLESKEKGLEMVELRWRGYFPERKRGMGVLWSGKQIRDF